MIQELQSFFSECPLLENREVNVDFLGSLSGSVSISPEEGARIIKSYVGGGSLREYPFGISLRLFRNTSLADNLRGEQFTEELADWVEMMSDGGNLIELGEGLCAQRLEVLSGGWLEEEDTNYATYKIKLRLIYTKM